MSIPKSHPRYVSLKTRDTIVDGVKKGITSTHGLIAHGRGEAFDYLIKEKTQKFALEAIEAAACLLLSAKEPLISVNGNVAALCPKEIVSLAKLIPAKIEVNIFHTRKNRRFFVSQKSEGFFRKSKKRGIAIAAYLAKNGAKEVLMPKKPLIKYIESNRRFCNPQGIAKADVVFVPLEDGDRCKALEKMGKKVITVDLNPMSRTSKAATITIVDNIKRALPILIKTIKRYKKLNKNKLKNKIKRYNNKKILKESLQYISKSLS